MKFSFLRFVQWIGITIVVVALVGLNFNFESRAGKTVNAPVENSLSQSMRGSWFLDDGSGTNATDSSGNGNTLAMTGSPSWVAGQIGPYSLDFSGSGQYLSVADPASGVLDFGDGADFTVSGWFNRDTFANDHTIVAKRNSSATNTDAGYIVWIDAAADKLNFTVGDGGGTAGDQYTLASTSTFTATGWHQFTAVWDDSLGMQLYIDGKLDNSTTSSTSSIGSLANALAFRIGAESDAGVPFDGKIDNITLYGRALSTNEVSTLYQTAVPIQPVDTGLVGHWTFDGNDVDWGNASTEIKDVSGKGNDGDAAGSLATTSVLPGKLGQALSFNGTSDYVTVSDRASLEFTTNQLTLSAWVKWNEFPGASSYTDQTVLGRYDAGSGSRYFLYFFRGGGSLQIDFLVRPSAVLGPYYLYTDYSFNTSQWYFLTAVYNDTNISLFINGTLINSDVVGGGSFTDGSTDLSIGWGAKGIIDDARVYSRALSTTEIMNLYTLGR